MMPINIIPIIVTIIGLGLAIWIGYMTTNQVDFLDFTRLALIASPAIIAGVLFLRKFWIGVAIGLIPLSIPIPVAILSRFGIGSFFVLGVCALVLGGICFRQYQNKVLKDAGAWMIMIAALFVWGRFIYDRPGSANLGEAGGGGMALTMVIAYLVFFCFSKIAAQSWSPKENIMPMVLLLLVSMGWLFLKEFVSLNVEDIDASGDKGMLSLLYRRPGWLLCAILFAWILIRFDENKGPLIHYQNMILAAGFIIFLSVLTPHRSRPLFALATIFGVAWVCRQQWKVGALVGLMALGGLGAPLSIDSDRLPASTRRALSTIIPIDSQEAMRMDQEFGMSSEKGWESEFRTNMNTLGFEKMKENPLFGGGFSFKLDDLLSLYAGGSQRSRTIGMVELRLALVGGYHNSIIQLGANCGIPAAVCTLLGMMLIIWRFALFARGLQDPAHKLFAAALIGCLGPLCGQMLINGAANDLYNTLLFIGIANGMMQNKDFKPGSPTGDSAVESVALPPPSRGPAWAPATYHRSP